MISFNHGHTIFPYFSMMELSDHRMRLTLFFSAKTSLFSNQWLTCVWWSKFIFFRQRQATIKPLPNIQNLVWYLAGPEIQQKPCIHAAFAEIGQCWICRKRQYNWRFPCVCTGQTHLQTEPPIQGRPSNAIFQSRGTHSTSRKNHVGRLCATTQNKRILFKLLSSFVKNHNLTENLDFKKILTLTKTIWKSNRF